MMRPNLHAQPATVHWEVVTWACKARPYLEELGNEIESAWVSRMPPQHVLQVTVYEVCSPSSPRNTNSITSPGLVFFQHLLAVIYDQRRGIRTVDALFVISGHWAWDQWTDPQENSKWTRPRHLVNLLHEGISEMSTSSPAWDQVLKATNSEELGRWLFQFPGPPGEHHVCE